MTHHSLRSLLALLLIVLSAGCTIKRPALTKEGLPDSNKRMSITHWALDQSSPQNTIILSFAYPERTSLFHTRPLRVGQRQHQYRLDHIENSAREESVTFTDLDTGKPVVLTHKRK